MGFTAFPAAASAPTAGSDEIPLWKVALQDDSNPFTAERPTKSVKTISKVAKPSVHTTVSEIASRIEACESGGDAAARNAHSTAKGLFQFLDGTWSRYSKEYWGTSQGHSVLDAADNRTLALYVISTYGTADWNASKHCWA